jgi:hypothetical protein
MNVEKVSKLIDRSIDQSINQSINQSPGPIVVLKFLWFMILVLMTSMGVEAAAEARPAVINVCIIHQKRTALSVQMGRR